MDKNMEKYLTKGRFKALLQVIVYKNWLFHVGEDGDRLFLQVTFPQKCSMTRQVEIQKSRKWFLSPHMTNSEFVQTCFKAVMTAEEHEARESFQYKGSAVYGPHFDVDSLAELCEAGRIDVRKNPSHVLNT